MIVGVFLNMILYGVSTSLGPDCIKELTLLVRCYSFRFALVLVSYPSGEFHGWQQMYIYYRTFKTYAFLRMRPAITEPYLRDALWTRCFVGLRKY